jgi:hypothetical protein
MDDAMALKRLRLVTRQYIRGVADLLACERKEGVTSCASCCKCHDCTGRAEFIGKWQALQKEVQA